MIEYAWLYSAKESNGKATVTLTGEQSVIYISPEKQKNKYHNNKLVNIKSSSSFAFTLMM